MVSYLCGNCVACIIFGEIRSAAAVGRSHVFGESHSVGKLGRVSVSLLRKRHVLGRLKIPTVAAPRLLSAAKAAEVSESTRYFGLLGFGSAVYRAACDNSVFVGSVRKSSADVYFIALADCAVAENESLSLFRKNCRGEDVSAAVCDGNNLACCRAKRL